MIIEDVIQDLLSDTHSGASDLARKAALGLLAFCRESAAEDPAVFIEELTHFGRAIVGTQPTMAPLFNLVNQVLRSIEPLQSRDSAQALQQAAAKSVTEFLRKMDTALEAIAEHGQGLLPSGGVVMTHSSSKTVIGILKKAVWHGKELDALVTESRPFCEGRELARHLGQSGIHTRVILDAAVGRYVREADVIIVGVDRIAERSFVNKVGTLPLAMAARQAGVPLYVACEVNKLLPEAAMPVNEGLDMPDQSQREEWMNVELLYSMFEEIPNSWLTGLITEEGIISLNALAKLFHAFQICSALPLARAS
jgi:ribose 1,5-bisphosphate isomerase